jgi:hypothetical protein
VSSTQVRGRRPRRRRFAVAVLLVLLLAKPIWLAAFHVDAAASIAQRETRDLLARRAYLIERVYVQQAGLDDMPGELPEFFQGEWVLGTHSMTALALTNLAFAHPETRAESLKVVDDLLARMLTPELHAFDTSAWNEDALDALGGPHGHVAYFGHLNLMLAAYHYLGGTDARYGELFDRVSAHLRGVMGAQAFLNAETYPGEIYVMDNVAALASLALYDRLYPERAGDLPVRWAAYARVHLLDPDTGLLVFAVDGSGRPIQGGRGSGATWAVFFLSYVDADFAREQFALVKQRLVHRELLVATGVRERPGGGGLGDVDSGPLVLGLNPSATGFAMAGATLTGDAELLDQLLFTAELAGFSWEWNGQRHYLLAPLVGEAILLAMRSVTAWPATRSRLRGPAAGRPPSGTSSSPAYAGAGAAVARRRRPAPGGTPEKAA